MSRQLPKSVLPVLISIAFLGLVLMAMQLTSRALPVRASIASVRPNSDASNQHCPAPTTEPPPLPPETEWHDTCVTHRLQITGAGLGDAITSVNPRTLDMANPEQITWLLAQVAGRTTSSNETPESVVFTSDTQSIAVDSPTKATDAGYTFETNLQPSGQITAWVNHTGSDFKTPRGLVVYARQDAGNERWTSVGKTMNEYVYRNYGTGSHVELLSFEALTGTRNLDITAVVIDNNEDDRPMVVEAIAGSVTASRTFTGPTEGALLNIVSLTLPQVPTGTDQVTVTLRSPAENGDSLVWVGVNVGYRCGEDDNDKNKGIYLPIVLKDYESLICNEYFDDFSNSVSGWRRDDVPPVLSGYSSSYEYFIERQQQGFRIESAPLGFATHYTVEVDIRWDDLGYEYGIVFGQAETDYPNYSFGIDTIRKRYRVIFNISKSDWRCVTQGENCWINNDFGASLIQTNSSSNHLKLECDRTNISLYLNQGSKAFWQSNKYSCRGRVGIFAQSSPSDPFSRTYFDNFNVRCSSKTESTHLTQESISQTPSTSLDLNFRE